MILAATQEDAEMLREIAVSAFIEDRLHQTDGVKVSGPPGHDQLSMHERWIAEHSYFKFLDSSGKIVGGCYGEIRHARGYVHGVFVGADSMRSGVGRSLVLHLMAQYPAIGVWQLETPDYALRNQAFYESLGFRCTAKTQPDLAIGFGFFRYERSRT